MARIVDEYTTTAAYDLAVQRYGTDPDKTYEFACDRCGGSGYINYYAYHDGGVCYGCQGSGGKYVLTTKELLKKAKARDSRESNRARKEAKQKAENRAALDKWKKDNADLLERAEAVGCNWWKDWTRQPSERSVENLTDAVARKEIDRERLKSATPVPDGKEQVTGVVVSWKEELNTFSYTESYVWKIIVLDDRGFKVYGTCPKKLADEVWEHFYSAPDNHWEEDGPSYWVEHHLKGARVSFTATLEQSRDDQFFGYFKRPTKPEVLAYPERAGDTEVLV